MKLAVHSYLHSAHDRLWLAAVPFPKDRDDDVVSACLKLDRNISARLNMLYMTTIRGVKLRDDIVDHLDDGIYELIKGRYRVTFFVDDDFRAGNFSPKVIVFLSYFMKKTRKTPASEISTAKKQRQKYLENKESGNLLIIDMMGDE